MSAHPAAGPLGEQGPEELALAQVAARIDLPPGWRVLRAAGRLEARFSSPTGTQLAFSVRLGVVPAAPDLLCVRAPLGTQTLTISLRGDVGDRAAQRALGHLCQALGQAAA
jgi:hypothetical protein